jgi:hypothetical protein
MGCKIAPEADYLRAELFNRETAGETRAFFAVVALENRVFQRSRILLNFRSSLPFSPFEQYELVELLIQLASDKPSRRIALVGDSDELYRSLEHVASLTRQRGHDVYRFKTEALALLWLVDRRRPDDRRIHDDQNQAENQRHNEDQRRTERRRFVLGNPQMA